MGIHEPMLTPSREDAGTSAMPGTPPAGEPVRLGIERFMRRLDRVVEFILFVALVGEVVVLFGGVVAREIAGKSWPWTSELAEVSLTTIAFVGGAIAYRKGSHISFELLIDRLRPNQRAVLRNVNHVIVFWAAVLLAVVGTPLVLQNFSNSTPIVHLPLAAYLAPLPLGMVLLALYAALESLEYRGHWRSTLATSVAVLASTVVLMLLPDVGQVAAIVIGIFVLLILLVLGVSIGFLFAISTAVFLLASGAAPLQQLGTSVANGITGFLLLSVPFFIFAGYLMTEGGLSRQIIDFCNAIFGRLPGGLWQVAIGSTFIFSGLTGAKIADVAAIGATLSPEMEKRGYRSSETASILAASAALGETIPPSTAMIVLGSVTSVSIGALFLGGVLPALLTALLLAILVALRAKKLLPKEARPGPVPVREIFRVTLMGIPALVVPIILIGGIISGLMTPTEVSTAAVVYGTVVVAAYARRRSLQVLRKVIFDAAVMSGMVLFIVATATALAWSVTIAGIPRLILDGLTGLGGGEFTFWIFTMLVLVLAGALLEGLPAIILFGPLFLPIALEYGISPVHYGVLLVAAMGVGAFMPPIGIGSYVTAAVCKIPIADMIKPYLIYGIVLVGKIGLIAFVPFFTLWLPGVLGL